MAQSMGGLSICWICVLSQFCCKLCLGMVQSGSEVIIAVLSSGKSTFGGLRISGLQVEATDRAGAQIPGKGCVTLGVSVGYTHADLQLEAL